MLLIMVDKQILRNIAAADGEDGAGGLSQGERRTR